SSCGKCELRVFWLVPQFAALWLTWRKGKNPFQKDKSGLRFRSHVCAERKPFDFAQGRLLGPRIETDCSFRELYFCKNVSHPSGAGLSSARRLTEVAPSLAPSEGWA